MRHIAADASEKAHRFGSDKTELYVHSGFFLSFHGLYGCFEQINIQATAQPAVRGNNNVASTFYSRCCM